MMDLDEFLFKTSIRFSIKTENIQPEIITQELNIQPDYFFKKGDPITFRFSSKIEYREWNLWSIDSPWTVLDSQTVSHHIEYLKKVFLPKKNILEKYKDDEEFNLSFCIDIKTTEVGVSLDLMENELDFLNRFSNKTNILFLVTDRQSILK